jgi:hypothetical protein
MPGVIGFVSIWRVVSERLMQPHGIVKRFDILEHAQPRRFQIGEPLMPDPLVFEGPEETFMTALS